MSSPGEASAVVSKLWDQKREIYINFYLAIYIEIKCFTYHYQYSKDLNQPKASFLVRIDINAYIIQSTFDACDTIYTLYNN